MDNEKDIFTIVAKSAIENAIQSFAKEYVKGHDNCWSNKNSYVFNQLFEKYIKETFEEENMKNMIRNSIIHRLSYDIHPSNRLWCVLFKKKNEEKIITVHIKYENDLTKEKFKSIFYDTIIEIDYDSISIHEVFFRDDYFVSDDFSYEQVNSGKIEEAQGG